MVISIRKSKVMHVHTKTRVSATTEADVASLNLKHKCSACAREFTKQRGLSIHMARWCDGGRTQRSRLGTLTDKAVKTAKRRAAEATLGKVQIENNVLDNVTLTHSCEAWNLTKAVSRILNGFNSRCLHVITGEEYRDTAISPAYNLLLAVRQRRLRYLGHLLRLPRHSVVLRTLIAMTDGDNPNRYPEGSIFIDCQGSELKYLETLAVNRTAWRHTVAPLVF